MYKIMIVEDDMTIGSILGKHLEKWGYQIVIITDFAHVLDTFLETKPDMVLLDISLPFYNGYYWCSQIRQTSKAPIIFMSSKSDAMDLVMAMNVGGDDYITKPYDLEIVTAKITALLRRSYDYRGDSEVMIYGPARLNTSKAELYIDDTPLNLTKNEYRIFLCLLEHKGTIVSRDRLMQTLWDSESFVDDNTLTVNVTRLRKKLDDYGLNGCIETRKGQGYILND